MLTSNPSPPALEPKVYIIGAGSGDPELLTVKAQRLISQADVVIFADSLVPPPIIALARDNAEKIRTANKTLEDIVPLMVERVRSHQSVVRLHSGDPSLYSAIHEQMHLLAQESIPFEVIPGISAFQAAAALLKTELTVPELVQSIILTRVSGRTHVPEAEELSSLAAHQASLCLYLSARHIDDSQAKLLEYYSADTPVAVCFRVGWPDEKLWVVPLAEMAALTHREELIRTTLYIVSPALAHRPHPHEYTDHDPMDMSLSTDGKHYAEARSRLYNPTHSHLFRAPSSIP
ncbi:MAG: precorrin-4 C(11)-methyltransferase [Merismopedia sp. SIO2A8]|nr:precorrin-4 C(11)-methyltransferase [Merismopedia sp. SIO2A8]